MKILGLRQEDRLLLLLPDTVDYPVAFWGAVRAGVVPIPINTLLPPETIAYVLEDSRAQALAQELTGTSHLVLICGRYEGVDERVAEALATDEISIGDYVLSGGEPAALVLVDAGGRRVALDLPCGVVGYQTPEAPTARARLLVLQNDLVGGRQRPDW